MNICLINTSKSYKLLSRMNKQTPEPTPIDNFRAEVASLNKKPISEVSYAELRHGVRNGLMETLNITPLAARIALIASLNSAAKAEQAPQIDGNIVYQKLQ